MQLYDRVLQSRNMDTLALLSLACAAGLGLYAATDYLRSACLVAIAGQIGTHLAGPVLDASTRQAARGDGHAGPTLVRDLHEITAFMSSGTVALPLDALCAPLFLAVLYGLHPAFCYLALTGVAALILAGILIELVVRPALLRGQAARAQAAQDLSAGLAEPAFAEALGLLPALCTGWSTRHRHAIAETDQAGTRALWIGGTSRMLRMALQAAIMALGAVLILAGAVTPGALMGANLLLAKILGPFDNLVASGRQWASARAAWQRLQAIPAPIEPPRQIDAPGGLWVNEAAFETSTGRPLLTGITFHAPPGTLVATIGPNGAGKTTLLRLLAGVIPPTHGDIALDGTPTHGGPGIGYLPPTVALLDGTIGENIAHMTDPASAIQAARAAGLHDLIGRMSRGYDTLLAANGTTLSGGMRQRIGLARALHTPVIIPGTAVVPPAKTPLLVLDEPDANLDGEGLADLLTALRTFCANGGIAVVSSHRPALRQAADLILTLDNGHLQPLDEPVPA